MKMLNWLRFEKRESEELASEESSRIASELPPLDTEADYETPLLSTGGPRLINGTRSTSAEAQKSPRGRHCSDLELATCATSPEIGLSPGALGPQHEVRRKRVLGLAIIVAVLAVILITSLLYPRGPSFYVDSFNINEANSTYTDGDRLMTNWHAKIGIDNGNFYPISIREVNVTAYLDNDRRAPIGTGSGKDLKFPARSHSTGIIGFQMPVYAPSTGLPSLIGQCMISDKVDLYLEAFVDLSWTHWSGRKFPIEIYATVDCKIPAIPNLIRGGRH